MKTFNVLSPDGFAIEMDAEYSSVEEARTKLEAFINRYKPQGYYSSPKHGRIPYDEIYYYCTLQTIENSNVVSVETLDFDYFM